MRKFEQLNSRRRRRIRRMAARWLKASGVDVTASTVEVEDIERFRRHRRQKIRKVAFGTLRDIADELATVITSATPTTVDDLVVEVLEDYFEEEEGD